MVMVCASLSVLILISSSSPVENAALSVRPSKRILSRASLPLLTNSLRNTSLLLYRLLTIMSIILCTFTARPADQSKSGAQAEAMNWTSCRARSASGQDASATRLSLVFMGLLLNFSGSRVADAQALAAKADCPSSRVLICTERTTVPEVRQPSVVSATCGRRGASSRCQSWGSYVANRRVSCTGLQTAQLGSNASLRTNACCRQVHATLHAPGWVTRALQTSPSCASTVSVSGARSSTSSVPQIQMPSDQRNQS